MRNLTRLIAYLVMPAAWGFVMWRLGHRNPEMWLWSLIGSLYILHVNFEAWESKLGTDWTPTPSGAVRSLSALALCDIAIPGVSIVVLGVSAMLGGPAKGGLGVLLYPVALLLPALVGHVIKAVYRPSATWQHIRGTKLWVQEHAQLVTDAKRGKDDPGLSFGPLRMQTTSAALHSLVVGSVGSGKSVFLKRLMRSALAPLTLAAAGRPRGDGKGVRAVIYDAKADIMGWLLSLGLKCPVVTMNPFDARAYAWDMAKDIEDEADVETAANILFPIDPKATQKFWDQSVHAFFQHVTLMFIRLAGSNWTFRDVLNVMRSKKRLVELLEKTEEGRELKELYANEKVFNDVMSTIAARTNGYRIIAALWDRCGERRLSLNEWVKGQGVLVLGEYEKAPETMKTINRILSHRLGQILLSQPETDHKGTRMTYWFNDEATALGDLPMREELIKKGRSKDVAVILGFQSVDDWEEALGEKQAHATLQQPQSIAVFRCTEKTAEWASKFIGDGEGWGKSVTFDPDGKRSETESRQTTRAVMPEEIANLPKTNIENGLHGYFRASETHFFRGHLSDPFEPEVPAVDREPDFTERPPGHQTLRRFDEGDAVRLQWRRELEPAEAEAPVVERKKFRIVRGDRTQTQETQAL